MGFAPILALSSGLCARRFFSIAPSRSGRRLAPAQIGAQRFGEAGLPAVRTLRRARALVGVLAHGFLCDSKRGRGQAGGFYLRNASALRCSAKSRGRPLALQAAKRPEKRERAPEPMRGATGRRPRSITKKKGGSSEPPFFYSPVLTLAFSAFSFCFSGVGKAGSALRPARRASSDASARGSTPFSPSLPSFITKSAPDT